MTTLRWVNEALAFLLELVALAALCYWGITSGSGVLMKVMLGLGAPVAAAVVWWLFAAPRAVFAVPLPVVLVVKAVVFGAAAVALVTTGRPGLAIGFAVLAAVNTTVVTVSPFHPG